MKKKIGQRSWKKFVALGLAAAMTLSIAGCGDKQDTQGGATDSVQIGTGGYVYVPEYMNLSVDSENSNIGNIMCYGDYVYYNVYSWDEENQTSSQVFYRKEIGSDKEAETIATPVDENGSIMSFVPTEDGSIYYFMQIYEQISETEGSSSYYIVKYGSDNTEIFKKDLTELLKTDESGGYIQYAAVDKEGRIYISSGQKIWFLDAEGNHQGDFQDDNWINDMGTGKDGKVYATHYGNTSYQLSEVDYNAKGYGKTYENFPSGNGSMTAGKNKDFLVSDSSKLYEYDLATQSSEVILNWMDSDISGDYVQAVTTLEDGRILAVIQDWSGETTSTELAMLTKTEASKVTQKEVITIGSLYLDQSLQMAAVKFNKTNDKYRVSVKTYIDETNWTENSYTDGITAMNTDITSGKGPDIIELSNVNSQALVSKGLIEDLGPYLDSSSVLKRDDFLEPVLNAFMMDGTLVGIPTSFYLLTVFGRTSMVGSEMGWTLDEMIALADQNPEMEIFGQSTKDIILDYCFMYNQNSFIDAETGKCNFDSDEFRKVLEFSNRFPKEYNFGNQEGKSYYAKVRDGEVLLLQTSVSDIMDYCTNIQLFGEDEVTPIGYPTLDGSVGCLLNTSNGLYGISTKSSHKDGAWAFLEFMLSNPSSRFNYGLSSKKSQLEETFEEAMKITYVLDENGEPMLDENGNKIKESRGGWSSEDFTMNYYGATQEDVDNLKALIEVAKPISNNDQKIMEIVKEEAAPYFEGQKGLDDVVNIIQSRVSIYLSENN